MRSLVPRLIALLLFALASVPAPALAQSQRADPVSGVWTGWIGESPANPHEIRFELTLKSDGSVTGTAGGPNLTPGVVESGTFDRTTRALKLTVMIRSDHGEGGRVQLEGKVAGDSASGAVLHGDQRGMFRLARLDPNAKPAAPAMPTGDPGAAARRGLVEVSGWITRAAELVPAERYSYRPIGTVRTFGELVAHVVDGSKYYCGRAAGRNVEWSDATEKTVTTKSALQQALTSAFADCKQVYDGASAIGPMMENLVHNGLHYGNMITYLRMMGLTPPSS